MWFSIPYFTRFISFTNGRMVAFIFALLLYARSSLVRVICSKESLVVSCVHLIKVTETDKYLDAFRT